MMELPLDCKVKYFENYLTEEEAAQIFDTLINAFDIADLKMKAPDGSGCMSENGKIMFMDEELFVTNKLPEEIWGKTGVWPKEIFNIKEKLEILTDRVYNVCVCIYYPDGNSGVGYHSDFVAYGDTKVIPSISIGAERMFYLREKINLKEYGIKLKSRSLLIMGENCQERYEHSLPIDPRYKKERINLTFRTYGYDVKKKHSI